MRQIRILGSLKHCLLVPVLAMTLSGCASAPARTAPDGTERTLAIIADFVTPLYPRRAAIKSIEGYVTFGFDIDADGKPKNIRVIESVPTGVFDDVGMDSLQQSRFEVPQIDGEKVRQKNMQYTYEFTMG